MYDLVHRLYNQAERDTMAELGYCGHPEYHRTLSTRFTKLIAANCQDVADRFVGTELEAGAKAMNNQLQAMLKS